MVRRAHEPEQDITLTGETNAQDFPAKVVPSDAAQQDNARRVAAAKEADVSRQLFESQQAALAQEPVTLTSPAGTKVTASPSTAEALKAQGYK